MLLQAEIQAEVKKLLALKTDYKAATGHEWKPQQGGAEAKKAESKPKGKANTQQTTGASGNMADSAEAQALKSKIDAQGIKVRDLKTAKAAKVSNF